MLQKLSESLIAGDADKVTSLVNEAIDQALEPQDILNDGLIAGMNVIGEKFKNHVIFLPDVLMAAKAMTAGMHLLKPLLVKEGIPLIGRIVIGTVKGDMHDIGKNLVSIMLKGAGFEVIDLGKDVAPADFVEAAIAHEAQIIGLSALLTTTMPVMKEVVALVDAKGISAKVKVIIGGAPASADYAREIGAHAYCFDGVNAVDCARQIVGVR
jgi:5-methyltetrahydrofolate--homocysteine methyltransferase